MPWRKRGTSRYYYRKKKVHGQIVETYVGRGEVARLVAVEGKARRDQLLSGKQRREELQRLAAELDEYLSVTALLAEGILVLAGYYRKEGEKQWRQRRQWFHTSAASSSEPSEETPPCSPS